MPDALYVHLYASSEVKVQVGGRPLRLEQTTSYPWDGQVDFTLHIGGPTGILAGEGVKKETGPLSLDPRGLWGGLLFTLGLRLPGWCRAAALEINGEQVALGGHIQDGYIHILRRWKDCDRVTLVLSMPVDRIEANPKVLADCGRVALQRGPVVYCLEQADNGPDLNGLRLPGDALLSVSPGPKELLDLPVISGTLLRLDPSGWDQQLYRLASPLAEKPVHFTAVPYAFWANRSPGEMMVWLRK